MPRVTHRRPGRAVAALLATGVLGGCAGTVTVTSTSTPAQATASTAARAAVPTPAATLAGGGASASRPPVTGTAVPGSQVAEQVRAAVEREPGVHLDMTTPAGSARADLDLRGGAARVEAGTPDHPVTLVRAKGSTWVKGAAAATDPAHPWLQLRADGTDVVSRRLGALARPDDMLRLTAFTSMLDGLTGDRTPLEGGTRTSFWVPAGTYLSAVRADPQAAAGLTRPVVVVLDLDDANRPMRLTATLTTDAGPRTDDTRYSGWGQAVAVEPPPQGEVVLAPLPGVQTPAPDGADGAGTGTAPGPATGAAPGPATTSATSDPSATPTTSATSDPSATPTTSGR